MAPVAGLTPAVPSSLTRKHLPSSSQATIILFIPLISMTPISGTLSAAWTVGGSPVTDTQMYVISADGVGCLGIHFPDL